MNYRHAYHAGNFADCVKHAVLVWLLAAMARKDKPFLVLDTHAGIGRYDLDSEEASRTGEWQGGIGKLLQDQPVVLRSYVKMVERLGIYPGSPAIAQAMLREFDRLVCCELHPADLAVLRRNFGRDGRVSVHLRNGYEALGAFLPPPERRGLVLIDPPYEAPDEFETLARALAGAHARFATGVFVAWYPIKDRAAARALHGAMRASGMRDVVAAEFCLREPLDAARLNGCGLLVVNPPWRFEEEVGPILAALLERLGTGEAGASATIVRLSDE
jgi:23S rRNA (adenine2030-N6)-methyltransferase